MNLATICDPHPDDAVALVSRAKPTTYGELRQQVAALRGGLVAQGLEPGDRLALACGNNWYFVVSYLAALGAGLVVVPVNPTAPGPEVAAQLAAVDARALVAGPAARGVAAHLDRAAVPTLEVVITSSGGDVPGSIDLDDLLGSDPVPMVDRSDDDLACLLFTSGTAGSPRAAMLTHGNLRANLDQIQAHTGRRQHPDDISFGVLPLFHIFGLNVVLNLTLLVGGAVVLVERFDPTTAIEAIDRHRVSVVVGAPPMWGAWAGLPDVPDGALSSVRVATSGAARLPVEVAEQVERRYGVRITEGYGLTEASPVVSTATGTAAPFGSIGTPLPGVELRLVDAGGDDVLVGDPGELWVRGPNVFAGYWGDPDTTASVVDGEGWLHTGDIAVVDDDGYLSLVDRAKDLVIVSGFNVFPAEVEEVLALHPAVEAVAVVGVPHPYTGEAVRAHVVLHDGVSAEEDDLIAWCAERLARYKCPDKILFVDELPVGAGGKVLRRALR